MSGKRRAGGPVRQLSLQSTRRQLRKQSSEDNPRVLRRQNSEEKGLWDHGLRVLATSIVGPGELHEQRTVRREAQPAVVRPRPVRIAWSERRQVSCEGDVSVGVVVQRCKGLPRPVTAKPVKSPTPPESILYSRTQLNERLRLAWKDRQERPNIDIFLARNSLDLPDEGEILSVRDVTTEVEKSAPKSSEDPKSCKFTPLLDIVNTTPNLFVNNSFRPRNEGSEKPKVSSVLSFPTATFPLADFRESTDSERERECVIEVRRRPKLTPSITISFDHGTDTDAGNNENDAEDDALPSLPHSVNDNLLKPDCFTYAELTKPELSPSKEPTDNTPLVVKEADKPKEPLTATMRRANFRNSNNTPVISGAVTVLSTPPPTPTTVALPAKPILKKPSGQPLTRMMSAPASGRSPSPQPQRGILTRDFSISRPESKNELVVEPPDVDEDDLSIVQRERNVKSAPARRKFKGSRRKGAKGHEDDSSEDETFEDPLPASKPRNRKRFVERGADIVTMVSLLSPNESEVEDTPETVVVLPQEPQWTVRGLTQEPRVETKEAESRPHTAGASPATPAALSAAVAAASIVCLRKLPAKTVSFQPQGSRSYTASYPSRRGVGTAPLPPESPTPPPPPPSVPALPLARRRLAKARSVGTLGQENSCESDPVVEVEAPPPVPVLPARVTAPATSTTPTDPEDPEDPDAEPAFKTEKERECWQMFRKMADKGVAVSYDTVLRGMLTPTEYRLHKKSMSSAC